MAKQPAGKKPVPRSSPAPKPAAAKKVAGKATPVVKPAIKAGAKPVAKVPVKRVAVPAKSNPKTAAKEKAPAAKKAPAKKVATKAPLSKPKPRSAAKASSADVPQIELTAKQQRFIDEYLVDLNGTQAAIRAGYSPDTAKQMASENLSKPYLQLAIAEARKQQQARTHINADALLLQAWMIATADSRELTEVHVGCCRHCWGEGFKYQRTVAEFNKERERFDIDRRMGKLPKEDEFDEKGGIGYDPLKAPHPGCTQCRGDGYARDVVKDTRYLSPAAVQLYAGVKRTKDGLQVLQHSKEAFAEKLWKHLGLYEKDNEQKADPLTTLLSRIATASGNGFVPVQNDPESATVAKPSAFHPRQDVDDEDD